MEYIYTFVGGSPDFLWFSRKDFLKRFGIKEAVGYLKQIQGTLSGEARDHRRPGCFYTGLRHVFAEIDGLGKLYKGEYGKGNTAWNAVHFGKDYLGKVSAKYEHVFGLSFDMYRHGLAHGHQVRTARFLKGRKWNFVYWMITEERADHLALKKDATGRRVWLVVSVPQLIDDTIAAIDYFIADLEEKGATSRLFARFKRGYAGTCVSLRESPRKKGTKKLALNQYSQEGIDWLRREA